MVGIAFGGYMFVKSLFPEGEFDPLKENWKSPTQAKAVDQVPDQVAVEESEIHQVSQDGPVTLQLSEGIQELRQKQAEKHAGSYTFRNRAVPAAEDLAKLITGESLVDTATNAVHYRHEDPGTIRSILVSLDTAPVTLEIEAVLGLFRLDAGYEFGVSWLLDSTGVLDAVEDGFRTSLNGAFSFRLKKGLFQFALNEGKERGFLQVMARPVLSCVTGQTARLSSGRQVAVPVVTTSSFESRTAVEFREVALSLEVVPILLGDRVFLTVTQSNDDILGFKRIDGNEVPEISTQLLQSSLELPLGDWIALGGATLINHSSNVSRSTLLEKVPVLRSLLGQEVEDWDRVEFGVFLRVNRAVAANVPLEIQKPRLVPMDTGAKERIEKKSFWDRFGRRKRAGK